MNCVKAFCTCQPGNSTALHSSHCNAQPQACTMQSTATQAGATQYCISGKISQPPHMQLPHPRPQRACMHRPTRTTAPAMMTCHHRPGPKALPQRNPRAQNHSRHSRPHPLPRQMGCNSCHNCSQICSSNSSSSSSRSHNRSSNRGKPGPTSKTQHRNQSSSPQQKSRLARSRPPNCQTTSTGPIHSKHRNSPQHSSPHKGHRAASFRSRRAGKTHSPHSSRSHQHRKRIPCKTASTSTSESDRQSHCTTATSAHR